MKHNNIFGLIFIGVIISLVFFNQYFYNQKNNTNRVIDENGNFLSIDPVDVTNIDLSSIYKNVNNYLATVYIEEEKEKVVIPPPETDADSYLVYNLTTDEVIWEKEPTLVWPQASLTKLMTAVIAVESIGYDTEVEITPEVVSTPEISGYFEVGEKFAVRDIIHSLFLVSSNDGAVALMNHYGEKQFLQNMSIVAQHLNMNNTVYVEPTGLSARNVSTVHDLKNLVKYIYTKRPELVYFSRQPERSIVDKVFQNVKYYQSINEFAGQSNFIGGKTGYIEESGGNLVSIFSKNNQAVLIIVLGTEDRFKETRKLLNWVNI